MILTFIERLLAGESPTIDGSGEQSMDFVHVRDIARAIVLALESEHSKTICNIGTGEQTSIADLARLLIARSVSTSSQSSGHRCARHRGAAPRRAAEVLGFRPGIGVKEGLGEVVADVVAGRG